MTKEGYLQLKIGELEEKMVANEKRIDDLLLVIQAKESSIKLLLQELSTIAKEAGVVVDQRKEVINYIESIKGQIRESYLESYNHLFKKISVEQEKTMNVGFDKMLSLLAGFSTMGHLLAKLLIRKNVISKTELSTTLNEDYDTAKEVILRKVKGGVSNFTVSVKKHEILEEDFFKEE